MLTRKDFVELARIVRSTRDRLSNGRKLPRKTVASICALLTDELAGFCVQQNPAFDSGRFRSACQPTADVVASK